MMAVPTPQDIDMQIQNGIGTERSQELLHKLKAKLPDRRRIVRWPDNADKICRSDRSRSEREFHPSVTRAHP